MAGISESDARKLVIEFAADNNKVAELKFINDDTEGVTVRPCSGGLVNHVFCVTSVDGASSVVIKHSQERLKEDDPDALTIPISRQQVEYDCLEFMDSLIPGSVPKPYCIDRNHNIIAMQDMSGWELLGDDIKTNGPKLNVAERIGTIWGIVHRSTSKLAVTPMHWKQLAKFRQVQMKAVSLHFLLERPLEAETDSLMKVPEGALEVYRQYVKEYRETGADSTIKELYNSEHCLMQFDAHWKSAFVKDEHVAVFDLEFTFLGHPGPNIAYCINSYIACFLMTKNEGKLCTQGHGNSTAWEKALEHQFRMAVVRLLTTYLEQRTDMSNAARAAFLSETALFASVLNLFLFVFTMIDDIDPGMTNSVKASIFPIALRLLRAYRDITTVEAFAAIIFMD